MLKTYDDFATEAQQYANIITKYQKTGEVFVDPNFHPQAPIHEYRYRFNTKAYQWKRIDEYFKAPLFKPELIDSNFIQQGELGDCYFLSALSRIARQPELVRSLFDDQVNDFLGEEENTINIKCGAVVIYFHAFGTKTPVLIDTQIPFKRGTRTPRFVHPTDLNVSPWFCLVEKAYAKLNGSYEAIDGGTFPTAIYSLFGYFPDVKWVKDLRDPKKMLKMNIFDRLMKYQRQGSVMGAAIHDRHPRYPLPPGVTADTLLDLGLVTGHSYVLMKARTEDEKNFVCLRNPWGGHEWLGDWSDTSDLWTDELKEALGMTESEDGSFWMIDKDFFYYFNKIDIARPIPPEFHTRSYCVQLTPGPHDGRLVSSREADVGNRTNFAFQITEPLRKGEKCKVYITIERRHQFVNEKTNSHIGPTNCSVLILQAHGQKLSYDVYRSTGDGQLLKFQSDLFGFTQVVKANRHIYTIFIQRNQKANYTEDCYVQVYCKYDFKLYDIDNPDLLIQESQSEGIMFDNYSVLHPDIAFPLMKMNVGGKVVNTFDKEKKTVPPPPPKEVAPEPTPGSENSDEYDEEEETINVTKEELEKAQAKAEEEAKAKAKAEEDARLAMEEVERLQKMMKEMENRIAEHEKKLKEEKEKEQVDSSKQAELEKELELEKTLLATNRQNIKKTKKNAKNLKQKAAKKREESNEADLFSDFLFQSFRPGGKPKKSNLSAKKSIKEIKIVDFGGAVEPTNVEEHSKKTDSGNKSHPIEIDGAILVSDYDDQSDKDDMLSSDSDKSPKETNKGVILTSTSSDDDDNSDKKEKSSKPLDDDQDEEPSPVEKAQAPDPNIRKKARGVKSFRPKISPV